MTIMTKMFHQCLFYYYGLKLFRYKVQSDLDECDGPNPKYDDKLIVTISNAV